MRAAAARHNNCIYRPVIFRKETTKKQLKQEYSGSSTGKAQDVYAKVSMNIFNVIPRSKSLNLLPRKKVVLG
jgi:hypothetical protein